MHKRKFKPKGQVKKAGAGSQRQGNLRNSGFMGMLEKEAYTDSYYCQGTT